MDAKVTDEEAIDAAATFVRRADVEAPWVAMRAALTAFVEARERAQAEGTSEWPTEGEWWAWHPERTQAQVVMVWVVGSDIETRWRHFDRTRDDGRWRFWPVVRPRVPEVKP